MSDKVRIGFVGAGYMGQKAHLDNYVTLPDCEVVALAEGRAETAKLVAARYGIPNVYPDHRAMLQAEDLDAVVAIMYYGLHHSVVPDILRAGKHVLTEKPMCVCAETGRELARLAREQGVIYYVGYMKRSAPATQAAIATLQAWRQSGEFGAMSYLRAAMPPGDWVYSIEGPVSAGDAPPPYEGQDMEAMPQWMDEKIAGIYNAFVNYYIHQVNLIRYLLGEDYHVRYADPSGAALMAVSESGIPVSLEMKGYGLQNGWEETYRVLLGQAKIDLSIPSPMARQRSGELQIFRGKEYQSVEQPLLRPQWAFLEQARHFVACVKGEAEPRVEPEEAVKDLEVAEEYAKLLAEA